MVSKAAIAIPIAVGAAGVSLYALLAYHRRNRNKDVQIKDCTEHRMVINKVYANVVLGQLDFIRQTSNTLIRVLKISDEDQTFSIVMKGNPESVQEAEFMVNGLIEASPEITTSLVEVPKDKIKCVVGDFGNSLLAISQETGSKLFLKCDPEFYEASELNDPDVVSKLSGDYFAVSPFYIEIQGPREKNALAYEMIRQRLGQDPSTIPSSSTNRWNDFPKESAEEVINASQNSKYVAVTVSAITSINKFYVQLYSLSSALAKMEERIADHFGLRSSLGIIKKPKIGTMIAVPYAKQGKWHRAMIARYDRKNVETSTVHAVFLDYGDSEDVKIDEIRALPAEFSHIPDFAVECSLAAVLPKTLNAQGEQEWSEEALDFFESFVCDRPNKILMARKYEDYEVVLKRANSTSIRCRHKIPALDMVDTSSSEDVAVRIELISKGYAYPSLGNKMQAQPSEKPPITLPKGPPSDDEEEELDMPLKG